MLCVHIGPEGVDEMSFVLVFVGWATYWHDM